MTATKRKALATRPGRNKVNSEVMVNPPSIDSSSSAEENTMTSGVNLTISKKTNKPLMEKRRRARINESLALLKDLVVVEADNPSKLEKADILELTVTRVRELCDFQKGAQEAFQDGFKKCLDAASKFLEVSGLEDISAQLRSHLTSSRFIDPLASPQDLPTPLGNDLHPPVDMLNEPINLALLRPNSSRNYCSVWRPW